MPNPRSVCILFTVIGVLFSFLLQSCSTGLPSRQEPPPPPPFFPAPAPAAPQMQEETSKPEGPGTQQVGKASWYGSKHQGKETASGETFDQNELTAAHPTLPLGAMATVTNLETGDSVDVKITDRGPYVKGRKIDLSKAAAQEIGMTKKGVTKVKIVSKASRKGKKKPAQKRTTSPPQQVAEQATGSGEQPPELPPSIPVQEE